MLLVNDPYFFIPDPIVIVPEISTELTFNYDFVEGFGNADEFRVTLLGETTAYELLFANVSGAGIFSLSKGRVF